MLSRFRRSIWNTYHQFLGALWAFLIVPKIITNPRSWAQDIKSSLDEYQAHAAGVAKKTAESSEQILYGLVGQALTCWALMENAIVATAALLLRRPPKIAGLVMFSIINFNVWLALVSDLFEHDSDLHIHRRRWNKISERIRAIKDQRDQLAHHPVSDTATDLLPTAALQPSTWDIRLKTKRLRPLDAIEVIELTKTINTISKDIFVLISEMQETIEASLQKPSPPETDHSPESGSR